MNCFWIFGHKWSKWDYRMTPEGKLQRIETYRNQRDTIPLRTENVQERQCEKCGFTQIKKETL